MELTELAGDIAGLLGASGREALLEAKAQTPRSAARAALSFKQQADLVEELKKEAHALLSSPRQRGQAAELQQLSMDAASSLTSEAALAVAREARADQPAGLESPRELAAEMGQMKQHADDLSSSASLHHIAHDALDLLGPGGAEALQLRLWQCVTNCHEPCVPFSLDSDPKTTETIAEKRWQNGRKKVVSRKFAKRVKRSMQTEA
jgi:hypothetical protein